MYYREWVALNKQFYADTVAEYPSTFNYLLERYGGLEIKYAELDFDRMFKCYVMDNMLKLNSVEALMEAGKKKLTIEDTIFENITTSEVTNMGTSSYAGWNVEGDYTKNKDTANNITKTKGYSFFNNLKIINRSNELLNIFTELSYYFRKLLVTKYSF